MEKPGHEITAGMRVDVDGCGHVNEDGESCILASTALPNGTGSLMPLCLRNDWIGGNAFGFQDAVAPKGYGLNNIGLLVRTSGRVTEVDSAIPAGWFRIDDGSGVGVKCVVPEGVSVDPSWQWVGVTGVSSCEKVGEELHRLLRVRRQSDITPF